jgi:hypothetical protein
MDFYTDHLVKVGLITEVPYLKSVSMVSNLSNSMISMEQMEIVREASSFLTMMETFME